MDCQPSNYQWPKDKMNRTMSPYPERCSNPNPPTTNQHVFPMKTSFLERRRRLNAQLISGNSAYETKHPFKNVGAENCRKAKAIGQKCQKPLEARVLLLCIQNSSGEDRIRTIGGFPNILGVVREVPQIALNYQDKLLVWVIHQRL